MNHLSDDEHHHDPFHPLATATLDTPVFDVVHMFSERGISAVPIVDADGSVIDMYEAVDIVVRPLLCYHSWRLRHFETYLAIG